VAVVAVTATWTAAAAACCLCCAAFRPHSETYMKTLLVFKLEILITLQDRIY
jgi:hypothetical protein